ncbi:uncharacterized protein LOC143064224 [Mytilus galloprovincialis]|uniref:uncharacterized protein LOC143064224 n=1 Tax=Mytilus galloprovincialis TaxID=29158 RepID=UPI003F7B609E
MVRFAVLALVCCILCEVHGSSPPLSNDEISKLPPDLQLQFLLPSPPVHLHQTRVGFKHRWVDHSGRCHTSKPSGCSVAIDATTTVSDLALTKGCTIVGLMTRHMSSSIFCGLGRSHGLGIFAKSEGPGIYPENYNLKDTPQCHNKCDGSCKHTCTFDGRKYDSIAGLTNTRAVVLEDNVLCNSHDPYGHKENILVHEFAHLVDKYMPKVDRDRLRYVYNYIKQHGTWQHGYGTANSAEYWAEATSSFFHTIIRTGADPAVGMNNCNFNHLCGTEMENRAWLKKHDIWLYNLLVKIYTNNNPTVPSTLKVCQ